MKSGTKPPMPNSTLSRPISNFVLNAVQAKQSGQRTTLRDAATRQYGTFARNQQGQMYAKPEKGLIG